MSKLGSEPDVERAPEEQLAAIAGSTVVLGVTGGIAAFKAVELCRRLIDAGAHVAPILTPAATQFVGEATFSALASEPARIEIFGEDLPIPHTDLGQRADLVIVAPATARLIGSYAAGISSDLLVATLLATSAPVLICPAMHAEMWAHPAVQENLAVLQRRGAHILAPATGRLAGGQVGVGRLPEVATIMQEAARILEGTKAGALSPRPLSGRRVLVSAGGTREPIDPVRYLSNRSSGKQGHALAEAALQLGAEVTLVTTSQLRVVPGLDVVAVETAAEMAEAIFSRSKQADVVVMAAAVADYRPAEVATSKLHKADGLSEIRLVPTVDILSELGRQRHPGQVLVGFAAETGELAERALAKLESKNLDLIVANDVSAQGVGFSHETNAVTIFSRSGVRKDVPLQSKLAVAYAVFGSVLELIGEAGASGFQQNLGASVGAHLAGEGQSAPSPNMAETHSKELRT